MTTTMSVLEFCVRALLRDRGLHVAHIEARELSIIRQEDRPIAVVEMTCCVGGATYRVTADPRVCELNGRHIALALTDELLMAMAAKDDSRSGQGTCSMRSTPDNRPLGDR